MRPFPSSTDLNYFSSYCAAAMLKRREGVKEDQNIFACGVAAHSALQAAAENPKNPIEAATLAVRELVAGERIYEGEKEPPYNPDRCKEGLDLALEYMSGYGLPVGNAEVSVAIDRDGKLVDPEKHPEKAWYGQLLDLVSFQTVYDEQEELRKATIVTDYKTFWPASQSLYNGFQFLGVAILAESFGRDMIHLQVVNLRRQKRFDPLKIDLRKPTDFQDQQERRAKMRAIIDAVWKILEGNYKSEEVASPGLCCYKCPFLMSCNAAKERREVVGRDLAEATTIRQWLETAGELYALKLGEVNTYKSILTVGLDGDNPISLGDYSLGFFPTDKRILESDALDTVCSELNLSDQAAGILAVVGLSVRSLGKLLQWAVDEGKIDWKEKKEIFESATMEVKSPRFQIKKSALKAPGLPKEEKDRRNAD